jgi:hypothetical protein
MFLGMRNISDRRCRENHNIHFIKNSVFSSKNHAIGEIMWKSIAQPDRPQMIIWRMRFACWIIKATVTNSEYVIVIDFRRQALLSERVSILGSFAYIACLVLR